MRPALLPLALLVTLAACGGERPRQPVVVAVSWAGAPADDAEWQRFEHNVETWAPEYDVRVAGADAAGAQVLAQTYAAYAAIVPELRVLAAPGLFASAAEADAVLHGPVLEEFRRLFAAQGLRLLQFADGGAITAERAWFDRLTPHDKDVFLQAWATGGAARAAHRAGDSRLLESLAAASGPAPAAASAAKVAELVARGKQAWAAAAPAPAQ